MQVVCMSCGSEMIEAFDVYGEHIRFYECENCGDTVIIVDQPEDERMEAADYEHERVGDR